MEVCMWPQSSRQLLINFCYVLFSVTSCLTGLKVMWRALWSLAAWPPSSLLTTIKSSYEDGDWQHPWFRLGTFTSCRWGQRSHRVISAFFLSGLSGTIWSRLIHTHHHWGMKLLGAPILSDLASYMACVFAQSQPHCYKHCLTQNKGKQRACRSKRAHIIFYK